MKEIISQQSIVDNMQTIYHLMGGLWNDTLIEARRFDSESGFLNGYLQYDGWMHDYIQPYMNVIRNVEVRLRQWKRNGGVINGIYTEIILIRDIIRQINPLMTPIQQKIELVNVYNLMTIYEDRYHICHKNMANMSEQIYYNFIKDIE